MIKAVVLDIDGVVVGSREGVNFPHPSKKISAALRAIHSSGIPVSFLSAKTAFAVAKDIKAVYLDTIHIADGGATLFNPIQNQLIHQTALHSDDVVALISALPATTYLNLFSITDYYLAQHLVNDFTNRYQKVVGQSPVLTNDLLEIAKTQSIAKLNICVATDQKKEEVTNIISQLSGNYTFRWTEHPHIPSMQVMVVTAMGVSKRSGVTYLAKTLGVSLDEILGVGDTLNDWDFIELCGYKAAMGNAVVALKEKIREEYPRHTIGGHVDEDGLLDVFRYFALY
jgi:HAD superfamily hydrolase (TIGR01484 family)